MLDFGANWKKCLRNFHNSLISKIKPLKADVNNFKR